MKMKYGIMMMASALVFATSCSDFLDEENKTGNTGDLIYSSETGLAGLVNSCYAYTRAWWGKEPSLGLSDCGSDLWYTGTDNKQMTLNTYTFTSATASDLANNNPCFDEYWEMYYNAVDVCNNAIYYVNEGLTKGIITEATATQYLGEIKFCRALYYFNMVAMWGPIPYNAERITATKTTPVRVPEKEVFANILKDIDEAIANLPANNAKKLNSTHWIPNKYAAEALKARVALFAASWLGNNSVDGYSGLYTIAQNCAQDVINNAGASFYTRYNDTWSMDNNEVGTNKEAIWGVYYDYSEGVMNCIPKRYKTDADGNFLNFNSLITRTGYTRGGSAHHLMFVPTWNNGNTADLGNGTGKDCIYNRPTNSTSSYIASKKTGENIFVAPYYSPYSRGFTRYLPSLYLWETLAKGRNTDQRFDGTLVSHYNLAQGLEGNRTKVKIEDYDAAKYDASKPKYVNTYIVQEGDKQVVYRDYYPKMGEFIYDAANTPAAALARDGNYFNAGDTAIFYSELDGDSPEGQAQQAWAKDRYRIQFAYGGDIPVYTTGDYSTALPTSTAKAVSDEYGDDRYNNKKIGGKNSFPGIKKFLDSPYDATYLCLDLSYRDGIVFRLAEMYLILAECQLQTGGDAAATINALRAARAIEGQDNSLNAVFGSNTVNIDVVLQERAIELCGEYQRWFDLKRTHKLIEYVTARNAEAKANIKTIHYYRPIPLVQMDACTNVVDCPASQDANGVLQYSETAAGFWQNPGY